MGRGSRHRGNTPSKPQQPEGHETTTSQVVAAYRESPIPPPSEFREYNELIPDGANRIMAQWEAETKHRHKLQSRAQLFILVEQLTARFVALLFAGGCLAVVVYALSVGAVVPASVIGGAMIIAGINAFLRSRK
jgi:uncharacterized membrane protein